MKESFSQTIKKLYPSAFLFLLVFSLVATCTPYVLARVSAGESWAGMTPSLSSDALRYFARANDVSRGNIFPHNPYYIEYKDQASPTPSVNDALVAFPQLIGLSFNTAYYFNIFVWGFLFLLFASILFLLLGVSTRVAVIGACITYLGVYSDMLRPGAMQIVFPLFLLFLVALLSGIRGSTRWLYLSGVLAGISLHSYIFSFMVSFAILGVYALILLYRRDWKATKLVLTAIALGVLVALPHFYHVYLLTHFAFYKETIVRMVMVYSHWPQVELYYYGRWVVIGVGILFLFRRYYASYLPQYAYSFMALTGVGILAAMGSNIVLGRDIDIATHVGRYSIMWYHVLLVLLAMPLLRIWRNGGPWLYRRIVLSLLVLLVLLQIGSNFLRTVDAITLSKDAVREVQTYRGVIEWFSNQPEGVVVAPKELMLYIPTLSKQYVLFSDHASLFFVPDKEVRERYMLSRAFDALSLEEFLESRKEYNGPTEEMYAQITRSKFLVCTKILSLQNCSPVDSTTELISEMTSEYGAYYPTLEDRVANEYARYHVRYIVTQQGEKLAPALAASSSMVYRDLYWQVYRFERQP